MKLHNVKGKLKESDLNAFSETYDHSKEDAACNARGRFIDLFPLEKIRYMKINDYVIGTQKDTFCAMVEAKTRKWANIQGSPASKFKLYYGKRKPEKDDKYRFAKQFQNEHEAFRYIKRTLLELVGLAQENPIDFYAIDAVDISQMFKAKILSLYFPERFANICSGDDLCQIATALSLGDGLPLSKYQNLIVQLKESNSTTRGWSIPKFMAFIYRTYLNDDDTSSSHNIRKPSKRQPKKVNFDDISHLRALIGEKAEKYALEWEQKRLLGKGLAHLIPKIKDLRDRPGYGYDYSSYMDNGVERYIEVKAVGKLKGGDGYRFFLSENEMTVSQNSEKDKNYYFYLVFFSADGEPNSLKAEEANKLYKNVDILPASYQIQFELDKLS